MMHQFWLCHPALYYGLSFLFGIQLTLSRSWSIAVPLLALWLPFLIALHRDRKAIKHLSLSVITFLTACAYTAAYYHFPLLPEEGIRGKGRLQIRSLNLQQSPFGERWIYRCELTHWIPDHPSPISPSHLQCILSIPLTHDGSKPRPLADGDYWVEGKLIQNKRGKYLFKTSSQASWQKIEHTWSWAEKRYHWKQSVKHWIETRYVHPLSGSFLAGLATGEFDDTWMRQQFARFGLQHLLAISGFHFAIIAGFLSFSFRLFLTTRKRIALLLPLLFLYCFFLGPQASILRAWLMCSLTLAGMLFEKQTTALNSLGVALLVLLAFDPMMSQELGFQLSFATTAAILLFFQPAQGVLNALFPKRRLEEVVEMHHFNQYGYILLAFFRECLALSLAVNLLALPLTLYYFQQFPWMSLVYNLFFPLMTSVSICLLLLGNLFFFLPPLASAIHSINDTYTYFLLQLTYQVPAEVDVYLTSTPISAWLMIIYLTVICLGGMIWKRNRQSDEIFSFV